MATEIYLGNPPENIVKWIKENYKSKKNVPLHFTANEPNSTIILKCRHMMLQKFIDSWCLFVYSTDEMKTWNDYHVNTDVIQLDECENKTVYIQAKYGDTEDNPNKNGLGNEGDEIYHRFYMEGSIRAAGNIQFLLDNTGSRMDVTPGCYYNIFSNCSSLTQAPELPATTLAEGCYAYMFQNCKSPFIFSDKTFDEVTNLIQEQILIGDYWYYYDEEDNEVIINQIEIICSDKTMIATAEFEYIEEDDYNEFIGWTLTEK